MAKDNRVMLNGMMWIARSGAQWRELPGMYGSWQNDHDSAHAIELLSKIDISESNILGDKAYGSKAIREYITEQGTVYTIPPRSCNSEQWFCDWCTCKERHLIECFFQKIKWFCRVVTRYDKSDSAFLGFIYLAAISVLLI